MAESEEKFTKTTQEYQITFIIIVMIGLVCTIVSLILSCFDRVNLEKYDRCFYFKEQIPGKCFSTPLVTEPFFPDPCNDIFTNVEEQCKKPLIDEDNFIKCTTMLETISDSCFQSDLKSPIPPMQSFCDVVFSSATTVCKTLNLKNDQQKDDLKMTTSLTLWSMVFSFIGAGIGALSTYLLASYNCNMSSKTCEGKFCCFVFFIVMGGIGVVCTAVAGIVSSADLSALGTISKCTRAISTIPDGCWSLVSSGLSGSEEFCQKIYAVVQGECQQPLNEDKYKKCIQLLNGIPTNCSIKSRSEADESQERMFCTEVFSSATNSCPYDGVLRDYDADVKSTKGKTIASAILTGLGTAFTTVGQIGAALFKE